MTSDVFSVKEMAFLIGISPDRLRIWMQQGLPVDRSKGRYGAKSFNSHIVFQWILDNGKKIPLDCKLVKMMKEVI